MKVLVLSCNMGQGHNTAAKAIKEEWERRGVTCDMKDALSFGGATFSKGACYAYTKIVIVAPKLYALGYRATAAMSNPRVKSAAYLINKLYRRKLWKFIIQGKYDTVITTHVFPAQTLTSIRKHYPLDAACYMINTDYTWIPFLEELNIDAIFTPHEQLMPSFFARGIKSPLVAAGIPVSARFSVRRPKEEARAELGLPQEVPIYLVMSGSMGFGQLGSFIPKLLDRAPKGAHVVVMGGNNEPLKAELRKTFDPAQVTVLDFTDKVSDYMDACDVLFTKPGGLTSTEAAVKTIALVHTAPIPGVEEPNVAFFGKNGMSVSGKDEDELLENAMLLLESEEARAAMRKCQETVIHRNSAAEICDYVEKDYLRAHGRTM